MCRDFIIIFPLEAAKKKDVSSCGARDKRSSQKWKSKKAK